MESVNGVLGQEWNAGLTGSSCVPSGINEFAMSSASSSELSFALCHADGALFRAALVASCFRGAATDALFRAVCRCDYRKEKGSRRYEREVESTRANRNVDQHANDAITTCRAPFCTPRHRCHPLAGRGVGAKVFVSFPHHDNCHLTQHGSAALTEATQ